LPQNLLFVKTPKVGGSTFGGVLRRIGCRHGFDGVYDGHFDLGSRTHSHTLLAHHDRSRAAVQTNLQYLPGAEVVALVRDPASRCFSGIYYFKLSRGDGLTPEEVEEVKWRELRLCHDTQLSLMEFGKHQPVSEVLNQYDLIGVTERFDETLLLLADRWGLDPVDLLYLKAKGSTLPATGRGDRETHVTPVAHKALSEESSEIQAYVAGPFRELNARDYEMHAAASSRMTALIATIPGFEERLAAFQAMLAEAETECRPRFLESCLWNDNGCAQACLDELVQSRGWGRRLAPAPRHDRYV